MEHTQVSQQPKEANQGGSAFISRLSRLLLPQKRPVVSGYALGWDCWSAARGNVTGDFYDALVIDDKYLEFVIGDVSGKGLEAAGRSVGVRNMWRGLVVSEKRPNLLLQRMNLALSHSQEDDEFVTVACGRMHIQSGRIRYARAGHPPPILRRASGACELLLSDGVPLGIDKNIEYQALKVTLKKGDALILYTDGLSELRRGRDFLDVDGLMEWVISCPSISPHGVISHLRKQTETWGGGRIADDIALFVIERNA